MALHNTEELKAGPTSQLESDVLNDQNQTYEFPAAPQEPQTVYQTIHNQLVLDGNWGKTLPLSAPPGSNPKSCTSWTSRLTKT